MKLFIDTANTDEIREVNSWGVLSGVTTNPSLAAKEGRPYRDGVKEICSIVDGPVSAECVTMTADELVPEAKELAAIADNVVVKVPMMEEGLKATRRLADDGVRINMTLVFSVNQALLAAQAGAAYVSPFIGRVDDIGRDGVELVSDIVDAFAVYDLPCEVIAASIRNPLHVTQVALAGADVATIPYAVFKAMVKHELTDQGIEKFLADWEKIKHL